MEINYTRNGILQINNARIIYRNFKGEAGKFNREGDRSFSIVIPSQELADQLVNDGWNIKVKDPIEEGDTPLFTLHVKIKFNGHGPNVYLKSGDNLIQLNEDSVACLDEVDIENVDMDIRPYDWNVNGDKGRTAYLSAIKVTQRIDRFASNSINNSLTIDLTKMNYEERKLMEQIFDISSEITEIVINNWEANI